MKVSTYLKLYLIEGCDLNAILESWTWQISGLDILSCGSRYGRRVFRPDPAGFLKWWHKCNKWLFRASQQQRKRKKIVVTFEKCDTGLFNWKLLA